MHEVISTGRGLVKHWTNGVLFEQEAREQVLRAANLPFVWPHVAVMPDVHVGLGATVGSVIPTLGVIIPAAVGVDIGCGMMAVRTELRAEDLPDSLGSLRSSIEAAVPHGRTDNGGRNDRGAWGTLPNSVEDRWACDLKDGYENLSHKYPKLGAGNAANHLGTLGTGNHFIEVCLDENGAVWVMLHSGSRGVGNRLGSFFIEKAKREMARWHINLPDKDLAYLPEGSEFFSDYVRGVSWAQKYAAISREIMMKKVLWAMSANLHRAVSMTEFAVNCHHNYVTKEHHYGKDVWVTRKGAVNAAEGVLGIIPGSMGAKSFIVRGKGNRESLCSCSHGAGRTMSRTQARKTFTMEDHELATHGVECRKDLDVIDETPAAYKSIDAVMAAQDDLIEIVHTLKQVLCVKG